MKGGTPNGQCTVCRYAVPPRGVPGFHQPDARRVSAAGPALRGRIPSPYGGVVPRWEAADGPPFQHVPELSLTDSWVAYLGAADNVPRPLPSRRMEVNQPVIRSRNPFSRPHPARLACL